MLDLDAKREERAAARRNVDAAGREARGEKLPIRIGGEVIAEVDAELNLLALKPLRELDSEMALIISKGLEIARSRNAARKAQGQPVTDTAMEATQLIVDLLVMSPTLPTKTLDIISAVARNVLGAEAVDKLAAAGLSSADLRALATGLFEWFGLSLGEALPSLDSSTSDGATSKQTSDTTTASAPETSSEVVATPN